VFTARYELGPLCYINERQTLGGRDISHDKSQAVTR
jgi:hypothetical protein